MSARYELLLADDRVVSWPGGSGEDAATRYVDAHRDTTVVAWRADRRSYAAAVAHRAELDDGGEDATDALAAPELLDDGRERCPSCGAELAGWHDDHSALCEPCQDELIAWRMTPRTREVILAALDVASRLPAQRAECQRVAEIVREAGQTGGGDDALTADDEVSCSNCNYRAYNQPQPAVCPVCGYALDLTGGE